MKIIKYRIRRIVVVVAAALAFAAGVALADITPAEQLIITQILELHEQVQELEHSLGRDARAELQLHLEGRKPTSITAAESPTARLPLSPRELSPADSEPTPAPSSTSVPREGVPSAITRDPSPTAPTRTLATSRLSRCGTFSVFDTNRDGLIDASDRYWRYLFLWIDQNRDGLMTDREVENPFDLQIQAVSVDLRFFTMKDGSTRDVYLDELVVFEPVSKRGVSRGSLVVDASRIQRFDGPRILGLSEEVMEGFQPFRAGMAVIVDGERMPFECP